MGYTTTKMVRDAKKKSVEAPKKEKKVEPKQETPKKDK